MIGRVVAEAFRRSPLLTTLAAAHLVLFVALIPAALTDPAQILGISRWIKPMKFAISVALYLATMGWLLSYLPARRARSAITWTIALTMTVEICLIMAQAVRGVQSHFNHDTPFDDLIFSAMGVLIVINTAAVMQTLILFFVQPTTLTPPHLTGVRLGLILFIAASLQGGMMVARDAHSVGVHDGGPGLPFVNWNTGAGDLRVAHFVGMHALQALPILGWWLDRSGVRRARLWIRGAAAAWVAVTVLLTLQALAGRPLIPMLA